MRQQIAGGAADTCGMLRRLLPLALVPLGVIAWVPAAPATAESPPEWCRSARDQVVEWSLTEAKGRGGNFVTAIRTTRTQLDRVIEAPSDGVVLRCLGVATLSNGLHTRVKFGFRAIDGDWYLFLKRAHGPGSP